jgi:molybdopterin molybdotransferase
VPTISPEEAWERIAARLSPLAGERAPRREAAGRVLAEALAATVDVPAADVSAMDGYALAGEVTPGERRPVIATIAAGDPPGLALPAGKAARIMTGAPMPLGADRVVPVEATRAVPLETVHEMAAEAAMESKAETAREVPAEPARTAEAAGPVRHLAAVELLAAAARGEHIRRRGEVLRAGEPLLPAGSLLTPGALALVATHGYAEVPVHRAPAVAVLPTGDEVVPPERVPGPGQLRDSHTDFLLAAGGTLGLRFTALGIAPDRPDELTARVAAGMAAADVLLICGGVSMGEFDLVEGALERLGCRRHFDAVAIQPGKPLVFATHPGGVVFGLPGNPASVMVGFWLFVRPALALLAGRADTWWRPSVPATLEAPLPGAAAARDRFLPAEVAWGAAPGGGPLVRPLPPKGSHDLAAYARGTALVRVRAGAPPAPAGARCEILPLPPPL